MRALISILMVFFFCLSSMAQQGAEKLEDLELSQGQQKQDPIQKQDSVQKTLQTATLKSAARLFGEKNDLTTVITIIPAGSGVSILDADSAYYRVNFEDYEGYILKRQAVIDDKPVARPALAEPETASPEGVHPVQQSTINRFTYLENKYGTNVATRINSGKIWKGMNGEMVRDSWGNPEKINRVISNNTVKEDWTYKSTMLYFENNRLVKWGPRK